MEKSQGRMSERAYQMEQNFMALRFECGYSIPEIAEMYSLTPCTVYGHLEKIAKDNNVPGGRDTLLQEVHKSPAYWQRQNQRLQVDANALLEQFDVAIADITEAITDVSDIIAMMNEEEVNL